MFVLSSGNPFVRNFCANSDFFCLNGGECVTSDLNERKHFCDCRPGFVGRQCEHSECLSILHDILYNINKTLYNINTTSYTVHSNRMRL